MCTGAVTHRAEAHKLDQCSGTFDRLGVHRAAVFQEWVGAYFDHFVASWQG